MSTIYPARRFWTARQAFWTAQGLSWSHPLGEEGFFLGWHGDGLGGQSCPPPVHGSSARHAPLPNPLNARSPTAHYAEIRFAHGFKNDTAQLYTTRTLWGFMVAFLRSARLSLSLPISPKSPFGVWGLPHLRIATGRSGHYGVVVASVMVGLGQTRDTEGAWTPLNPSRWRAKTEPSFSVFRPLAKTKKHAFLMYPPVIRLFVYLVGVLSVC